MPSPKRKLGDAGEEIALRYLKKQGYRILSRNYQKPWGEIDIVAQLKNTIVFVEVKSREKSRTVVPEANMTFFKQKRLIRAAQTYLLEKKISSETPWQIDVVAVDLDIKTRRANLRHLPNAVWA